MHWNVHTLWNFGQWHLYSAHTTEKFQCPIWVCCYMAYRFRRILFISVESVKIVLRAQISSQWYLKEDWQWLSTCVADTSLSLWPLFSHRVFTLLNSCFCLASPRSYWETYRFLKGQFRAEPKYEMPMYNVLWIRHPKEILGIPYLAPGISILPLSFLFLFLSLTLFTWKTWMDFFPCFVCSFNSCWDSCSQN